MDATALSDCEKTVGLKETMKAVEKNLAEKVFIAKDADARLLMDLLRECEARGIQVLEVPTKKELGRICHVQVGAAAAARLRA